MSIKIKKQSALMMIMVIGMCLYYALKNSFIYSQKELVAVADLEDVVIVETEDAIMAYEGLEIEL